MDHQTGVCDDNLCPFIVIRFFSSRSSRRVLVDKAFEFVIITVLRSN